MLVSVVATCCNALRKCREEAELCAKTNAPWQMDVVVVYRYRHRKVYPGIANHAQKHIFVTVLSRISNFYAVRAPVLQ